MRCFISVDCRQVRPSPNNFAAKSLAPYEQNRNTRKVEINANITFAIWIVETILAVVLFSVIKIWRFQEFTMPYYILCLHIVVPFIFLMNSSENRKHLVDVGFINILRNTIGVNQQQNIAHNQNVPTIAATPDTNHISEVRPHEETLELAVRLENPFEGTQLKKAKKGDGSLLSYYNENFSTEASNMFHIATTSQGRAHDPAEADRMMTKASLGSDKDDTLDLWDDIYLCVAGEILERMVINIGVECHYIFYLKELLRLEDAASAEAGHNLQFFEISEYDKVHFSRGQKVKNSQTHKNNIRSSIQHSSKMVIIDIEFDEQNVKFLDSFSRRRKVRKATLEHFQEHLNDHTSYKIFLNDLLDMEENLREN